MDIGEDWEQEDWYLAEVNLEDLESTSGLTNNTGYLQFALQGRQEDLEAFNKQIKVKQTHSGNLIYINYMSWYIRTDKL